MSIENLRKRAKFLTDLPISRNFFHPEVLDIAASYVAVSMHLNGCTPVDQTYSVQGQTFRNVIVTIGPEDAPRIVVGAHYDVCGDQPGADDNASAVAGLLELARLLAADADKLNYRIDLVAYTLEEPPAFHTNSMGSYVHAQSLKESGAEVLGMICLEMIGYFSDEPKSQGYPSGVPSELVPSVGNFIAIIGRPLDAALAEQVTKGVEHSPLPAHKLLLPEETNGVDFSDHWSFWKLGFQAVMLTDTAWNRNPNYHKATDTIDTLDFIKMNQVVQGLYAALMNFS